MYVIGKTGMGKSTMLENLAIQDIQNGEGLAFIDPHGSTAEKLLDFIPHERLDDVVYFAPFDTDYPVGFNVMEDVGYDKRHLVVSGLMGALKRIWVDAWSARMEYILQNTLLALLEYPESTLLDVNRMLTNKNFRTAVVEKITDPIVRAFWTEEFANFTDTYTREATPAIQNKIGQFVSNPLIRNIIGQPKSTFDLRKMMDEKKIFIVNLSKGRMGETNASLLGSMLTVKIYLASLSRADESPSRLYRMPRFYFYVDEFQSMMNEAFADILSEARKYKLALTLANQYIEQMEEKVRDAVFGNVGTLIVFRVGPFDAEVLKTVFEPTFVAEDLVGLGLGQIYLTLMIDGVGSTPFSSETLPPIEAPPITYREDVIVRSRTHFARRRQEIEEMIAKKQSEFVMPPKEKKEKRPWGGNGVTGNNGVFPSDRRFSAPGTGPSQGGGNQNGQSRPWNNNGDQSQNGGNNQSRSWNGGDQPQRSPIQPRESQPAYANRPPQNDGGANAGGGPGDLRSALRNAIQSAAETSTPAAPAQKTPLDVLRERQAQKQTSTPMSTPQPAYPKSAQPPRPQPVGGNPQRGQPANASQPASFQQRQSQPSPSQPQQFQPAAQRRESQPMQQRQLQQLPPQPQSQPQSRPQSQSQPQSQPATSNNNPQPTAIPPVMQEKMRDTEDYEKGVSPELLRRILRDDDQ